MHMSSVLCSRAVTAIQISVYFSFSFDLKRLYIDSVSYLYPILVAEVQIKRSMQISYLKLHQLLLLQNFYVLLFFPNMKLLIDQTLLTFMLLMTLAAQDKTLTMFACYLVLLNQSSTFSLAMNFQLMQIERKSA